jgi:hypothetical protein
MKNVLGLAVLALLGGCGEPDYPRDWPAPDTGLLGDMKGECPDLTGTYDRVGSELSWLLSADPDFEKPTPHWFEHSATLTQADDGSWLRIDFKLNEIGLPAYRDHLLEHNNESNGASVDFDLWLEAGKHFVCERGWLYSTRFAQDQRVHTWQRKSLQLNKDKAGGLIAGATVNKDVYLSVWAESQGFYLGSWDDTRWYQWPARDPSGDALLEDLQNVTLHRYAWVNHGRSIPVRFTSFYIEPICVRFFYGSYPVKVMGPMIRRGRDDPRPAEQACPEGWGRFDVGEVFRRELQLPEIVQETHRIEWVPMSEFGGEVHVIEIEDVRELPLMPERG